MRPYLFGQKAEKACLKSNMRYDREKEKYYYRHMCVCVWVSVSWCDNKRWGICVNTKIHIIVVFLISGFVDFPCSVCFIDPNPCVIVVIHKLNRYKHLVSFLFELHANGENIVVILFWFNISLLIFCACVLACKKGRKIR